MPLSEKNYQELYILQDKVLNVLTGQFGKFYLTGGTALGRFYLNHRYSEDLDLFVNQDPDFPENATIIRNILNAQFSTSDDKLILYPDFIRIWVRDLTELKVEMVNDVKERWGEPVYTGNVPIDTVGNILANKLTALVSRDEPKDVHDIVTISCNYSFSWEEVFLYSLRKAIITEPDVVMRLSTFPVELMEEKTWLRAPVDLPDFKARLNRIADDFLLARDNSLGIGKTPIMEAKPFLAK